MTAKQCLLGSKNPLEPRTPTPGHPPRRRGLGAGHDERGSAIGRSAGRCLAVAWNEEMVFRGYAFEMVREALGQGKALAVLIPGFALYHGLDSQQILGMLARWSHAHAHAARKR